MAWLEKELDEWVEKKLNLRQWRPSPGATTMNNSMHTLITLPLKDLRPCEVVY